MKDGTLVIPVVPLKDGALAHHLEFGPFPAKLFFLSVPVPFLRADEQLGHPREVVKTLKMIL